MTPEYLTAGGRGAVSVQRKPHLSPTTLQQQHLIGFTIDQSASMSHLTCQVVNSYNRLVEQQQELAHTKASTPRLTLTLFNSAVRTVYDAVPLAEVVPLTKSQYEPSGGTALRDGIGNLIASLSVRAPGRGHKVLCIIATDGEENQSRQYSHADIKQMIGYRQNQHDWQFIYVGPEESFSYAESIGILRTNCTSFESDPDKFRTLLERLGHAVSAYRLGDRQFTLKLRNS
jgi:hypothetical protein